MSNKRWLTAKDGTVYGKWQWETGKCVLANMDTRLPASAEEIAQLKAEGWDGNVDVLLAPEF